VQNTVSGVLGAVSAEEPPSAVEGLRVEAAQIRGLVLGRLLGSSEEARLDKTIEISVDYGEVEVASVNDPRDPGGPTGQLQDIGCDLVAAPAAGAPLIP